MSVRVHAAKPTHLLSLLPPCCLYARSPGNRAGLQSFPSASASVPAPPCRLNPARPPHQLSLGRRVAPRRTADRRPRGAAPRATAVADPPAKPERRTTPPRLFAYPNAPLRCRVLTDRPDLPKGAVPSAPQRPDRHYVAAGTRPSLLSPGDCFSLLLGRRPERVLAERSIHQGAGTCKEKHGPLRPLFQETPGETKAARALSARPVFDKRRRVLRRAIRPSRDRRRKHAGTHR
jgi:hypothetical protein